MPPELTSLLDHINLALLFKINDIKELKNDQVYKNLISDLNYLENVGISIQIENTSYQIYFSFSLVIGDNLGIYLILRFSENFVVRFPCRFCRLPKAICHE